MADTARTLAALQTLLADNSSGAVSAQDLRDMLESLRNDHGEISITSAVETTIDTINVWVEADAGTWALTAGVTNNFSMGTNGRLQYDGNETRLFHIACSVAWISAGNGKVYELAIGVDGTPITPSITRRKIGTGADVGATAVHALTQLATSSYLSLMVRNITDAVNVTLSLSNLFAMGMLI